jgi:hypothetical protein
MVPSLDGSLIVSAANNGDGILTAGAGFTNRLQDGISFADFTQGTAAAVAGTWTDSNGSDTYVVLAAVLVAVQLAAVLVLDE